jgi:hypothetical protein
MKLMTITTKDLMVDENGVFCENLQPAASQQQTLAVLTQFRCVPVTKEKNYIIRNDIVFQSL